MVAPKPEIPPQIPTFSLSSVFVCCKHCGSSVGAKFYIDAFVLKRKKLFHPKNNHMFPIIRSPVHVLCTPSNPLLDTWSLLFHLDHGIQNLVLSKKYELFVLLQILADQHSNLRRFSSHLDMHYLCLVALNAENSAHRVLLSVLNDLNLHRCLDVSSYESDFGHNNEKY